MKDLHNNVKVTPAINPAAAITGNGTTNGAIIDTQGFGSLEFAVQTGTVTDGSFAVSLEDGDQANLSDAAAVAASDTIGGGTSGNAALAIANTDDNSVKKIGYVGNKRYVRLKVVQSGATSGGFLAATAIQGNARNAPVA